MNNLCVFQVNSFQIAKFMFYYHNLLLPPMFFNLFLTSGQVHNYGTRTASCYLSHSCRTNLKQFTILYQGPKIWNSLPISITSSSVFSPLRQKCWSFYLKNQNLELAMPHLRSSLFFLLLTITGEVASLII